MPPLARIRHLTFDCRDPYRLARFWAEVLGFTDDPADPNHPGDPEALIVDPRGHAPGLLFIPVPEAKVAKNRLHLDLQPVGVRDGAVERLVELGGTVVDDRRTPDGLGWVVMADPEGNELCVERSATERDDHVPPIDTGERDMSHLQTGDERSMLAATLDWYREGVVHKVEGAAPAVASAVPFRSASSLAGLVKHLALVEDTWFTTRFAGRPRPEPWASAPWDEDWDWEFHSAVEEPLEASLALYRQACERSRTVVAEHDLEEVVVADRGPFSLPWALLHMIEETARHLGHLDVLREHLDGTTGE